MVLGKEYLNAFVSRSRPYGVVGKYLNSFIFGFYSFTLQAISNPQAGCDEKEQKNNSKPTNLVHWRSQKERRKNTSSKAMYRYNRTPLMASCNKLKHKKEEFMSSLFFFFMITTGKNQISEQTDKVLTSFPQVCTAGASSSPAKHKTTDFSVLTSRFIRLDVKLY